MSDYNGWTNRETWAVNLWLNNDEYVYKFIQSQLPLTPVKISYLTTEEVIGSYFRKIDADIDGNWYAVNWAEIAESWNE